MVNLGNGAEAYDYPRSVNSEHKKTELPPAIVFWVESDVLAWCDHE